MPRVRLVVSSLAATMLAAAAFGCGPRYVIVQPAPPPPPLYGRVSLEVTDHRDPKRGGADPSQIGIERTQWGIPDPIRVGGPMGLTLHVHDRLAHAANAVQIGVLPMGDVNGATSRLVVEIQSFWCDGYFPVFKAHAVLSMTILDGLTGQVRVPGQPLVADGEAGDCHEALQRMRRSLYASARGWFGTPQLHDALIAESAAAPPPPPASSPGAAPSPSPAPPPAPPAPPPSATQQPIAPY